VSEALQPSFALRGRIVTMDESGSVIDSGAVYVQGNEIVGLGQASEPPPPGFQGVTLDTGGTIYPGLIDLHNHPTYNVLPMWSITRRFGNRDELARHVDYARHASRPMQILGPLPDLSRAIVRYVECKFLLGGVTTAPGMALAANVGRRRFYGDVVRKVDLPADAALPRAATRVTDVEAGDAGKFLKTLEQSSSLLLHLADGVDAAARRHFLALRLGDADEWAITDALAAIHCTALERADFDVLARHGASMIWSPLADMVRYGSTADMQSAKRAGVLIGIGPDWSIWGSKNLLAELKVARLVSEHLDGVFAPQELVAMATINAARILKWDQVLGSIDVGKRADLVVVAGQGDDPYGHLLDANESGIALVVIDGVRRYGRPDLLPQAEGTELVSVGGEPRVLNLAGATGDPEGSAAMPLAEAADMVADALGRLPELATAGADGKMQKGAEISADGIEPIELDRLTVVDDPGYFDRLDAQLNLPEYLKTGLPPLYGQAPGLLLGGYTTDQPFGEDQLGIEGDVNMLCSVTAARNIDPPLSIGLFGAWGTGKSFFMEKMRARVAWLAENDRDSHSHVVQIRFNAWHYMDANLWASLAVTIFERLTDPEPVTRKQLEEREARGREARTADRRRLLSQLDMYGELRGRAGPPAGRGHHREGEPPQRAGQGSRRAGAEGAGADLGPSAPVARPARRGRADQRDAPADPRAVGHRRGLDRAVLGGLRPALDRGPGGRHLAQAVRPEVHGPDHPGARRVGDGRPPPAGGSPGRQAGQRDPVRGRRLHRDVVVAPHQTGDRAGAVRPGRHRAGGRPGGGGGEGLQRRGLRARGSAGG
jgi:5-methylthioadenosine/S-adenosylhomocysteine deaminase